MTPCPALWRVCALLALAAPAFCGCGGRPSEAATTAAAAAPRPIDPGLPVGERAPQFWLKDQTGAERPLAELRKRGAVVVVFFRSARW
jgi:hypothetical protein